MDNDFDLLKDFDRLASAEDNTVKGELYRKLYHIKSICTENWQTIPVDIQRQIIATADEALEAVRQLPSN